MRTKMQELMADAKAHIKDRDIFLSDALKGYLKGKAHTVHKHFGIADADVGLAYEPEGFIAFTNGVSYTINTGHSEIYKDLSRPEKLKTVCGLLFHEIGHRLFTCFTGMEIYVSYMKKGKLYPGNPKLDTAEEMDKLDKVLSFISDERQAKLLAENFMYELGNVLEDPRIEEFLLDYGEFARTLYDGLVFLRGKTYEKSKDFETLVNDSENEEYGKYRVFLSLMIQYGRYRDIKGYDEKLYAGEEFLEKFKAVQPHIDSYLEARTSVEIGDALNHILVEIWDFIEELFKDKDQDDEPEDNNPENPGDAPSSPPGPSGGPGSSPGTGKGSPKPLSEGAIKGAEKALSEIFGSLPTSKTKSELNTAGTEAPGLNLPSGDEDNGNADDKATSEGRPEYTRTDTIGKAEDDGKMRRRAGLTETSNTELDMERLLKSVACEKADEALENQLKKDLESFVSKIDFPSVHNGVSCRVNRHSIGESEKAEYARISPPLVKIAKEMARKSDFFTTDDNPLEVKNKYFGKRINPASLAKVDYRNFVTEINMEEAPTLSVAVLVDESGSMCGERSQYAKAAAIMLYEYCDLMEVPVMLYGHSTGNSYEGQVQLYAYADFDKKDPKDRYRLTKISARSSNRDGFALRFMKERLKLQDSDHKLLIIISDGEPAASGYYGTAAYMDLSEIAKECEKEDILLIAAAIGDDKEHIRAIYGDSHFLDISDLSAMPVKLTSLIKRMLK